MPRRIVADEEGYVYFAKTPSGYLYGPYSNRGIAAGVATQMRPYNPRTIFDSQQRRYVPNPNYNKNPVNQVVKAKLGPFEDAPRITQRERLESALRKLARIERFLADHEIEVDISD